MVEVVWGVSDGQPFFQEVFSMKGVGTEIPAFLIVSVTPPLAVVGERLPRFRSALGKKQRSDGAVCHMVCLSHDEARAGVSKVPLERQATGESRSSKHGHQVRRYAHGGLRAEDFGLQERED